MFFSRLCRVPKNGLLTLATSIDRPSGESLSAPSPRPSSAARSVLDVPSGPATVSSLPLRVTETPSGTSTEATWRAEDEAEEVDAAAADDDEKTREASLRPAEAAAAATIDVAIFLFSILKKNVTLFFFSFFLVKPPSKKKQMP